MSDASLPAARPRPDARAWLRATLPLALRKRLAVWVGRAPFAGRDWWSAELVRDWAERDANAYHRFLWAHHLAYARTYEPALRFGAERIHPSRLLLFDDLRKVVDREKVSVDAVLEVGCSMGYLLRHLETEVFPGARTFDGIDIDRRALERGRRVLRAAGSRVRLACGDA
ncbi:MAG TPA: class I SAM-dependent methyltransferase, partial [Longimicrobium sp.]|nr:class I SAM-dependent methyltransferase [Longimicrobium sp.]